MLPSSPSNKECQQQSHAVKRKRDPASDSSMNSHVMARPLRPRRNNASVHPSSSSDSIFSTPRQRRIRDREESFELLGRKLTKKKEEGSFEVGQRSVVPKNRCLSAPPARERDAYDRSCWLDKEQIRQQLVKNDGKAEPRRERTGEKWDPKWQFKSMANYWASLESLSTRGLRDTKIRLENDPYDKSFKEDCWKLYLKNIAPLELATPSFARLFDDMLLKIDFESKPLIMVVGQHEHLGKDYFVARLADVDYFPVDLPFWDSKFVFVAHSDVTKGLTRSSRVPGKSKGAKFYAEPGDAAESSMKERYVDEKFGTKKIDKMADKCRHCCPEVLGMASGDPYLSNEVKGKKMKTTSSQQPTHIFKGRSTPVRQVSPTLTNPASGDASGKSSSVPGPDTYLLNGHDSAKIAARIMNVDPIATEFGVPFLHAHSGALLYKSDALKDFNIVSCPDVPEDSPPDYSYEFALRYFARKAERIYFLIDVASDIDERSCLALEALAPFKPRMAFVFCVSKGYTDLSYVVNRHNAIVWNLSKILRTSALNSNAEIVDDVLNPPKRAFKTPPRIYSNLFNACGVACPLYGHQFRHAWTDLGDLNRFSASRLAREIRLRAIGAVVLAIAHNYVLKSQKKAFASISDVGAGYIFNSGTSRIKLNSINFKNTLAARRKTQAALTAPLSNFGYRRSSPFPAEQNKPRKRDERKECDGIQLLDEIEAATAKDPQYYAVAQALFEALKDLMIYKDFVNPAFVDKNQIFDAKKAVSILTKWINMDEEHLSETEQHFGEFDPCGSFGEIKAYFGNIVSVKLQANYTKTFYLALGDLSVETLPLKSLIRPDLPSPLPRGTSKRIMSIAQEKANEGVCREEFIAFMHLASLKSSGFELPVGNTPPRFTFTWKRKPATVLAKVWFTEKGATKVPTVQQKEAGQFFTDRAKKNYRHLNIKPLGLKVEIGPNGEQIILGPEDPEANEMAMQAFAAMNKGSKVPNETSRRKVLKAKSVVPKPRPGNFSSAAGKSEGLSWTRLFGDKDDSAKARGSTLVRQQRQYNTLASRQRLDGCSGITKCQGKQGSGLLPNRPPEHRKLSGAIETAGQIFERELLKRHGNRKSALQAKYLCHAASKIGHLSKLQNALSAKPGLSRDVIGKSGRMKSVAPSLRHNSRYSESLDATIKKLFEENNLDEISFGRTSDRRQQQDPPAVKQELRSTISTDSFTKSVGTKSGSLASQQKSFYASTPGRPRKPPPFPGRLLSGMNSPTELFPDPDVCYGQKENGQMAPTRAAVDELLEKVMRNLDKEEGSHEMRVLSPASSTSQESVQSDNARLKTGRKPRLPSPKSLARKAVKRALKRKNKKATGRFGVDIRRRPMKGILVGPDGHGFMDFENYVHYDTDDDSPMSIVASAAERKKLLEEVESIFHAPLPAEPNYDEVDLIIGERRQRVRRRAALGTVSRCCKHVRWNERVRVLGESDNMVVLCSDCDHVSTAGSDAESNDEKLADVGTDSLHQAGPPGFDDHGLEAMRVSVEPDILEAAKKLAADKPITIVTEDKRTIEVSLQDLLQLAQSHSAAERVANHCNSATSSTPSQSAASTLTASDQTVHPSKLFSKLRDFSVERVQLVKNPTVSSMVVGKRSKVECALDKLMEDIDPYSFEWEPAVLTDPDKREDLKESPSIWTRRGLSARLPSPPRLDLSSESIRVEAGTSESSDDLALANNPALNQLLREVTIGPKAQVREQSVFAMDETSFSDWSATAGSGGTSTSADAPVVTVDQRRLTGDGLGILTAAGGTSAGGPSMGQPSVDIPEVNTVRSSQLLPLPPSTDPLTAPTLVPNTILDLDLSSRAAKQGSSAPGTPVRSPTAFIPPGRRSMMASERSVSTSLSVPGGSRSQQGKESSEWVSRLEKPSYFVTNPLPTRETTVKHYNPAGSGSASAAPTVAAMVHQPGDSYHGATETGVRTTSLIGLPGSKYGGGSPMQLYSVRSTTGDVDGEPGGVGIVADATEEPAGDVAAHQERDLKFISFGFEPVQPVPAEDGGEQGTAEEIPPPPSPPDEPNKPPLMFGFVRLDPNRPKDTTNQAGADEPAGPAAENDDMLMASTMEDPNIQDDPPRSRMFSADPMAQEDRRSTAYSVNSVDDQPAETTSILGSIMSRFGGSANNDDDEGQGYHH